MKCMIVVLLVIGMWWEVNELGINLILDILFFLVIILLS